MTSALCQISNRQYNKIESRISKQEHLNFSRVLQSDMFQELWSVQAVGCTQQVSSGHVDVAT